MKRMFGRLKSRHMRRLVVTLAISGAGAAVAASVVWVEMIRADRSLARDSPTPAEAHAGASLDAAHDASLPSASDVLHDVAPDPTEPPTF